MQRMAQMGGRGVSVLIFSLGAIRGWEVNGKPLPLCHREGAVLLNEVTGG
jgi:hypothetical protein